jgi:single-stranded-DNA-specific exonuclease
MKERIELIAKKFLEKTQNKEIQIISHFDTDGITSASILIKTLKKLDKTFCVKIIKSLEEKTIKNLPKDKIIIFLDLASGALDYIKKYDLKDVFIIDHHEIIQEIPKEVYIINPELYNKEKISASGLTYLFCKEIHPNNELAKLAVLGMIGDCLEKDIDKLNSSIVNDSEVIKKRGLLLYPSTRPINRVLEYSSNIYLPGITGNVKGVLDFLREVNIVPKQGKYKSIIELDDKEMSKLVTSIMIRKPKTKPDEIVGDIFLIKMFNKLEDARELSAMINACSRLGDSGIAIQLCLEIPEAKKRAEAIHVKYKQILVSGLQNVSNGIDKIEGNGYVIINAKNKIRDTIIGTIASILSNSFEYEEGTIIIAMAYDQEKIKISSRTCGRKGNGKNLREVLNSVIAKIGGEVGGHEFAAGGIINKELEEEFINKIKTYLEVERVKI